MRAWIRTTVLLPLALLSAAWNGSGGGDGVLAAPDAPSVGVEVKAVGTAERAVHALVSFDRADGGTGVLSFIAEPGAFNRGRVGLPDADVSIRYAEYDARGFTLFLAAPQVVRGQVHVITTGGDVEVALNVTLVDRDEPQVWRQFTGLTFRLLPTDPQSDGGGAVVGARGGHVVVGDPGGGCGGDDDWDDDDAWDDDSWDDSSGDWGSSSGSGCDGDDLGGGSESSASGCEGDDLSGSDSGGCDGADSW